MADRVEAEKGEQGEHLRVQEHGPSDYGAMEGLGPASLSVIFAAPTTLGGV